MRYYVYAVSLYRRPLVWAGVTYWRVDGAYLWLIQNGVQRRELVPKQYVGFYARKMKDA